MTRKHNPLLALAALVILATILVLACTGCSAEAAGTETTARFNIEVAPNDGKVHQHTVIITDTETGVQYLYFKSMNSGGLTVLQPGEG
jgi:cytochrome b